MRGTRTALYTSTALFSTISPAIADPVSIGSAVLTALLSVPALGPVGLALGSTLGIAGTGTLVTAGLLTGSSVLRGMFARKPQGQTPDAVKRTTKGLSGPGRHAFGRVLAAGSADFGRTRGYFLHQLELNHFDEVDRVEEWFVNGVTVVREGSGKVISVPWARRGGTAFLTIETKSGTVNQTAFAELTNAYPTLWTEDHRNRGIASTLITAQNPGTADERWSQLYQSGFPKVQSIRRVLKPIDPRTGQKQWTQNGLCIALHYFNLVSGYPASSINNQKMIEAANDCDALITKKDGTQTPSGQLSGAFEAQITTDIVLDMLESAGLEPYSDDNNKQFFRKIEDYPDAELTFPNKHILEWEYADGPEAVQRPNICRVFYYSYEQRFTVSEIPGAINLPWARVQSEIDRYGEQEMLVELQFCPDSSQAQRIARRLFLMQRAERVRFKTSMAGAILRKDMIIDLRLDRTADQIETFRCKVNEITENPFQGTCEVTVIIIPLALKSVFNPATDEADPPPTLPATEYSTEVPTPSPPTQAVIVKYIDGPFEMRVLHPFSSEAASTEVIYNTYTNDLQNAAAVMDDYDQLQLPGNDLWLSRKAINLTGRRVDFRSRSISSDNELSQPSSVFAVQSMAVDNTVPSVPSDIGLVAILDNGTVVSYDYEVKAPNNISVVRLEVRVQTIRLSTGNVEDTDTTNFDVIPLQDISLNINMPSSEFRKEVSVRSRASNSPPSNWSPISTINSL